MGLILDTSVLILAERQQLDFAQWAQYDTAYISTITITELLVGVHRANTEERRIKRSAFVEYIIKSITALPFREEEARLYAELLAVLAAKQLTLGSHDLIIAATAIAGGHAVLTADTTDFSRIAGLEIIPINLNKS